MARLVLCVLALCAGALAHSNAVEKVDLAELAQRQAYLLELFTYISEPIGYQSEAARTFKLEDNLDQFNNKTAASTYAFMLKKKWYLPRQVPFSVNEPAHAFEALTLFNTLYSAKTYDVFYNTAAHLRNIVNEGLFIYVLSSAIIYRPDTQGLALPAAYEIFPTYFLNSEVIATAERINVQGGRYVEYYPSTYKSADGIVIKANSSYWPYVNDKSFPLSYFTEDVDLNAAQYFMSLVNPFWLGGSVAPGPIYKERRGEAWWFAHRQLVARYYMERLSNDLGEIPDITTVIADVGADILKQRQMDLMMLYDHIHEPMPMPKCQEIAKTWSIENNYEKFNNMTATKTFVMMLKNKWNLPRSVPFSVNEPAHSFEAMTLFNMLWSAKDYETFYNTAVYLRDMLNEGIYIYALSITIIYRVDTQGIMIPPIYEVFPSYFNNGEVMVTAQRINTHGHRYMEMYPSTFLWNDNVVIRWNQTAWPYYDNNSPVAYFTHDYDLNNAQYFFSLVTPHWMGGDDMSVIYKKSRGEAWWYAHKQLLTRYYMERLSNDLGEIPEITEVVEDGYTSGLLYHNGIPFPSRPNHYHLDNPELASALEEVEEYERRIWEAIDKGFFVDRKGQHVSLLTDAGVELLGRLIESNADSPNRYYYKDFIRIWKQILGNTIKSGHKYENRFTPLVTPSVLENYQTALRDPAYYMIWKRILNLFVRWQKQMPLYKPEELAVPNVEIEKVEVDKMMTYFEYTYMNVTTHLFQTEAEIKSLVEDVSVLVQYPRLNHKAFNVKVHVKSNAAKKVLVKFFLAPKYDSKGYEIPLHLNTENFFMLDQFPYELTAGDCVVSRKSTDFMYTAKEWPSAHEMYVKLLKGDWAPSRRSMNVFPHRLLLPKGKVGGMKFQLMTYIQELDYKDPNTPGYTATGYPTDRPLHSFQVNNVKNMYFQDVQIFHKEVPEVYVPHTY